VRQLGSDVAGPGRAESADPVACAATTG